MLSSGFNNKGKVMSTFLDWIAVPSGYIIIEPGSTPLPKNI